MRALLVCAFLVLAGCGGNIPPQPPEPPWECELDIPGCHETDPPMTCGECWHNPTTNPEHCEKAPECPPELPEPQCPTFTDRGGTERAKDGSCDCWIGQEWHSCPEPPPGPTECPRGQPQARVYWHNKAARWVADATPAVCAATWTPECYAGRYCHPLRCEGDPQRYPCEVAWMGGPAPVWQLKVDSGDLRLVEDQWFGIVAGHGRGALRWIYPNGNAVSKWLAIDK